MKSRSQYDTLPPPPQLKLPSELNSKSKVFIIPPKPQKKAPIPPDSEFLSKSSEASNFESSNRFETINGNDRSALNEENMNRCRSILKKQEEEFNNFLSSYKKTIQELVNTDVMPEEMRNDILSEQIIRIDSVRRLFWEDSPIVKAIESMKNKQDRKLDDNTRIVMSQAYVRRYKSYKAYSPVLKKMRNRRKVIEEIIKTEQSFIRHIELAISVFYTPAKENLEDFNISPNELKFIFGDLVSILHVNKEILTNIKEEILLIKQNETFFHACIGDTFIKFTPFLKVYINYINNYDKIVEKLSMHAKEETTFHSFIMNQNNSEELQGQTLQSLLIMPVQRLPRYELLLSTLLSYTDPSHMDYKCVSNAVNTVKSLVSSVNYQKHVNETTNEMLKLQKMLNSKYPELIQPHRKLIMKGPLVYHESFGPKKCEAYLFNDILMITKKTMILAPNPLELLVVLPLDGSIVEFLTDTSYMTNAFHFMVRYPEQKLYVFQAGSTEDRDTWVKMIDNSISILNTTQNSRYTHRLLPTIQNSKLEDSRSEGLKSELDNYRLEDVYEDLISVIKEIIEIEPTLRRNNISLFDSKHFRRLASLMNIDSMQSRLSLMRQNRIDSEKDLSESMDALKKSQHLISVGLPYFSKFKNWMKANYPHLENPQPMYEQPRALFKALERWVGALQEWSEHLSTSS